MKRWRPIAFCKRPPERENGLISWARLTNLDLAEVEKLRISGDLLMASKMEGKVGKAKRPRNIANKPNVFFRHQDPTPDIVRRPRGRGKQLEALYQLVPLARIPKRLRIYEDAAKVVQRRMVPNFKKSFERTVRPLA